MTRDAVVKRAGDVRDARLFYRATGQWTYFHTAAVGLASRSVADAYHAFVNEWMTDGLDHEDDIGPLVLALAEIR
jgi:hypothetical protein